MKDLSILIPSRKERFLKNTVEDALDKIEADTEIIAVLDGKWADPPVEQHDRVNLIYVNKPVGQRGGQNLACRLAKGKYVMKVDAHCGFDQGFDRKMLEAFEKTGDDVTMVPIMRNLWAFDWKCYHCGKRVYQNPTPTECEHCGKSDKLRRKIIWKGKERPQSVSYCFDSAPHFQYFNEYKKTDEYKKDLETGITKTMSLQGSAFMLTRENYWKWEVCDESAGSWGNQGIEVALATWLSGHEVLVNHNTWYAHMFRTNPTFTFPYKMHGSEVQRTKKKIKDKFWKMKHPKQEKPVSWLVERFWPVKGWDEDDLANLKELEKKYRKK